MKRTFLSAVLCSMCVLLTISFAEIAFGQETPETENAVSANEEKTEIVEQQNSSEGLIEADAAQPIPALPEEDFPENLEKTPVTTMDTLSTLLDRMKALDTKVVRAKIELKAAQTKEQKDESEQALNQLINQRKSLERDFEKISTGVDSGFLEEAPSRKFDWQSELQVLIEPIILEMKSFTENPRKIEKLNRDISSNQEKLKSINSALENIKERIPEATEENLKAKLIEVESRWNERKEQISGRITVAQYQLDEMTKDKKTFIESAQIALKNFFRTRGKNLLLALASFLCVILLMRVVRHMVMRIWEKRKKENRSFYTRLINVIYYFLTFFLAFAAGLGVLYLCGDWVLLSLAIIFLLGVSWTAKEGLPRFWAQIKFMLNLGNVKENERLIYNGVPWRVVSLNFYSELENPALSTGNIRLPLRHLTDMVSRPCEAKEPWFPCNEGDWVILSDGTRGEVILQTPELVTLKQRGGAVKSYVTGDFIGMNPLNITHNCRIKVTFGIDYAHQTESTKKIPEILGEKLRTTLRNEGHGDYLAALRVEFQEAGASSLDLVVIADFTKGAGPLYNLLTRAIQRITVDTCSENDWNIPYPQMVLHHAGNADNPCIKDSGTVYSHPI
jgi:small-conductance mechanosensitive channel